MVRAIRQGDGTYAIMVDDELVTTLEPIDGRWTDEDGTTYATVADCIAHQLRYV